MVAPRLSDSVWSLLCSFPVDGYLTIGNTSQPEFYKQGRPRGSTSWNKWRVSTSIGTVITAAALGVIEFCPGKSTDEYPELRIYHTKLGIDELERCGAASYMSDAADVPAESGEVLEKRGDLAELVRINKLIEEARDEEAGGT